MRVTIIVLIAFGFLTEISYSQRREGDRCRRKDTSYGTCKRVQQCPKAEVDYRLYQTTPEFCDFSITSQIICCPDNTDNEITSNEYPSRRNPKTNERSTTIPSLDTLLRDTGLHTSYRGYTTTTVTPSRTINQNNFYNTNNRNTDSYDDDFYAIRPSTTTRSRTTTSTLRSIVREYDRNNGRRPVPNYNADDLVDEAFSGQPTVRPDRPKRRDGQRISMQKCDEYKKLSKKVILFSPLLVNPTPVKKEVPLCDATTPLIVGGTIAKPGEFPAMAALGYSDDYSSEIKWRCGGTLISERYILTAAHCVKKASDRPIVVRLGEQNLATHNDGANPVDYQISQIITHPNYSIGSNYFDIALIRLAENVKFTSQIRPSCLWQTNQINSSKAIAIGWGSTGYTEESSDNLLKVDLNIYDNKACKRHYPEERRLSNGIVDEQLCAGVADQLKDTCQGDSGGPLHVILPENPCVHYVIGVTSFGSYCGGKSPGVYSRVSSYIDWIENVVWN
uniref:CSON005854 protein n=1 Tax=Culicoides sonorensis TaxID=179676 RepID=A0A336MSG3_CULSO